MILSGLWKKPKKPKKEIKYCCDCKYFQEFTDNIKNALCTHPNSIYNRDELLICKDKVKPKYYFCKTVREITCGRSGNWYEE
jgi:abortive infection bacteriophage resistance protein